MRANFWHHRWERNEIGFHQKEINMHLEKYWQQLGLAQNTDVFVPLCGKSLDMLWLAGESHRVLGIELSTIAVEAFFEENKLAPFEKNEMAPFILWQKDEIQILEGDFFKLQADHLFAIKAVYDRASLVAFPEEMRLDYIHHLFQILPKNTQILLVTFEYPPTDQVQGPPFSVTEEEVKKLYGAYCDIKLLDTIDILSETPRFQGKVDYFHEKVYLIQFLGLPE